MAIDKTDIWHLFDIAWEKYARPTQKLCHDLTEGKVDENSLTDRLQRIQRSSEIDTSRAFYYFGRALEKQAMFDGELSLMYANLLSHSVRIADAFHAELKEALDPPDFERILSAARAHSEDFKPLKFAGLKKEVDLACEILREEQSGGDGGVICPQAVSPAEATNEPPAKRKNTAPGDAEDRIIAALCKHHKYHDSGRGELSCENWEACGINALARLADVAKSSVTAFLARKLPVGPNEKPQQVYNRICSDRTLPIFLQLWRREFPTRNVRLPRENRKDKDDDG